MKKKTLLLRLAVLVAAVMCALGASAIEAYACYTSSNMTLTFYYDNYRSSRTGVTYDLNTGSNDPGWSVDPEEGTSPVTKVVFNSLFADARPTTTYSWFYGMENLQSITGIEYLNTSEVTNMGWMFGNCTELTSLDLSHFNTSKVTEMGAMFYCCSSLTSLDLSSFNTSKVTRMPAMFNRCTNLRTVYVSNSWSTTAVTYSANMFSDCTRLVGGQGTTYNASNPKDKTYAHIDGGTSNPGYFAAVTEAYACYTSSNTTLTFYYDTQRSSRSGTTYDLNTGASSTDWGADGTNANVTKVVFNSSFANARPTTTFSWFFGMANLQSITGLSYLNTSEVTNMAYMFLECSNLTSLDLSSFNTSKVTEMQCMFDGCSGLTSLDLSSFNTSQVTNMNSMFYDCSNLTSLDLCSFNISKVSRMSWMFSSCSYLQTIYVGSGWSTTAVEYSINMFNECPSLVGGQGTTYNDSNPMDKTYAHIDGGPSNPGYFTAEGTEAYACYTSSNTTLTFYYDTYRSSRSGTTYDLNTGNNHPGWETDGTNANVTKVVFNSSFANARPTSTYSWFYGMENLQTITGMNFLNTSEVTNMVATFANCKKMTNLDLSHFNTSKVTDMTGMFDGCSGLTSLDLSSFNTSKVTRMIRMFYDSGNLRTIYVDNGWSTEAVTSSTNMFIFCTNLVGGQGTTYNGEHIGKEYAHIDGGPSNPGYFTDKNAGLLGDVDGNGNVGIADVTLLIDYLLTGNSTGVHLDVSNVDGDGVIGIGDVTAIIDYILTGVW